MPSARRLGLANALMEQLHQHMMEAPYSAANCGLHVRVSNDAACRLYRDAMGYKIKETIKSYYQDGEDAFYMSKPFTARDIRSRGGGDSSGSSGGGIGGGSRSGSGSGKFGSGKFGRQQMRGMASGKTGKGGISMNYSFALPRIHQTKKKKGEKKDGKSPQERK